MRARKRGALEVGVVLVLWDTHGTECSNSLACTVVGCVCALVLLPPHTQHPHEETRFSKSAVEVCEWVLLELLNSMHSTARSMKRRFLAIYNLLYI